VRFHNWLLFSRWVRMSVIQDHLRPAFRNNLRRVLKYLRTWYELVRRPREFLAVGYKDKNRYLTANEFAGINLVLINALYNLVLRLADDPLVSPSGGIGFSVSSMTIFVVVFGALWVLLALVIPKLWQKRNFGSVPDVPLKRFTESLTYVLSGPGLLYLLFCTLLLVLIPLFAITHSQLALAAILPVALSTIPVMTWLTGSVIKTFFSVNLMRRTVLPALLFVILFGLTNYFTGYRTLGSLSPEEREAVRRLLVIRDFVAAHFVESGSWNPDIKSNLKIPSDVIWSEVDPLLAALANEAKTYESVMVGYRYSMLFYKDKKCILTTQPQRYQATTQLSFSMYCPMAMWKQAQVFAEDARGGIATASAGRTVLSNSLGAVPWYFRQDKNTQQIQEPAGQSQGELKNIHITAGPKYTKQADGSIVIEWQTDVESTSVVQYGTEKNGPYILVGTPGLNFVHRVETRPLPRPATYYVTVRSASAKKEETFITLKVPLN